MPFLRRCGKMVTAFVGTGVLDGPQSMFSQSCGGIVVDGTIPPPTLRVGSPPFTQGRRGVATK